MILSIVGTRDYTNYDNFKNIVNKYIEEVGIPQEIVSGGAKGVDTLAEIYAHEHNIPIKIFKPDWSKFGRAAGILRNTDIINYSTHVLALPNEKSVGTIDSINKAKLQNKFLKVVNI